MLLTGKAHTNVFDGVTDRDGLKFLGIEEPTEIGYLADSECRGDLKVHQ